MKLIVNQTYEFNRVPAGPGVKEMPMRRAVYLGSNGQGDKARHDFRLTFFYHDGQWVEARHFATLMTRKKGIVHFGMLERTLRRSLTSWLPVIGPSGVHPERKEMGAGTPDVSRPAPSVPSSRRIDVRAANALIERMSSATETVAKKPVSSEDFVKAWQAAWTLDDLCAALDMKPNAARQRESDYRKKGINLKALSSKAGKGRTLDVVAINKMIDDLRAAQGD